MKTDEFRDNVIDGVRRAYDTIAQHFSSTREHQWEEVVFLVEQYVRPGQTLLDIGCGNGRVAQIAQKIKANYQGSDLSPEMIRIAKERYSWAEFTVSDMQHLPYKDASADHIIAVASFHHLPDHESRVQALQEMARVVNPGGTIMLLNWNLHQPRFWRMRLRSLWQKWRHGRREYGWRDVLVPWKNPAQQQMAERYYHAFTKREMRRLVTEVPGIEIVHQYYEHRGMHVSRRHGSNLVTAVQKSE